MASNKGPSTHIKLAVFYSLLYKAIVTYDLFEPSTLISTLNVKVNKENLKLIKNILKSKY